jgi:hypothetical protein
MSSIRRTPSIVVAGLLAAALRPAGTPGETLRPDAFDAPAATSVREAERAAAAAASGHVMRHGTYRHLDAGREEAPVPDPHAGHVMPAAPDPHAGHVMPSPSPEPRR